MSTHHFNPENRHRLLSDERYERMPPDGILDRLPLRPAMTVGDIGCGPGFFALPLAARLSEGMVHAVDIEPLMLQTVEERAAEAGIGNIRTVLATTQAIPLPPGSLDGAFLSFSYHEIPRRGEYLLLLRQLVRPGGWLAILEWEKRPNPGGGPPLDARLTPEETAAELRGAGWQLAANQAPNPWVYLFLAYAPREEASGTQEGANG